MATLHIEHPITDLETWLGAFNRFDEARKKAGVRAQRIHQPVDDDKYIYVALDFDGVEEAASFKRFLETTVWASAEGFACARREPDGESADRGKSRRVATTRTPPRRGPCPRFAERAGRCRTTSDGRLSSRSPRNRGCPQATVLVHSAKLIWATRSGRVQGVPRGIGS